MSKIGFDSVKCVVHLNQSHTSYQRQIHATHMQCGVFNAINVIDRASQILVDEVLFSYNPNDSN